MKTAASVAVLVFGCATSAACGGLPKTFGECGASICEVDLAAFTGATGIPHCADRREDALVCGGGEVTDGVCDGLYVVRTVYGPPGDHFDCVYDDASGDLVGARWAPDAHPVQIAGEQPPATCVLDGLPCA